MRIIGQGMAKGLVLTFKHFLQSYLEDLKWFPRFYDEEVMAERQRGRAHGIFTVQYPEHKLGVPENFRYVPFLVYDEDRKDDAYGGVRCTTCGICAVVCPPQCIWIVRKTDKRGRPRPDPKEFYVDLDMCMNCGFCAEFCPFDSIKMDNDYEMAGYERLERHVHDLTKLLKPDTYYAGIRPTDHAREEAHRADFGDEMKNRTVEN